MADEKKTEDRKIAQANDAAASAAPLKVEDIKEATRAEPAVQPHAPSPQVAPSNAESVVERLATKLDDLQSKIKGTGPAGPTAGLSTTVPGGRFQVGGKLVDCHGRELNDDGSLKHPERQQLDAFGRMV